MLSPMMLSYLTAMAPYLAAVGRTRLASLRAFVSR
jgi:hypothetical protein